MSLKTRILLASVLLSSAGIAHAETRAPASVKPHAAQAQTSPPIRLGIIEPTDVQETSTIDFSALRYYVAQKDTNRMNAEIRLLRSLHPDWHPNADLIAELKNDEIEQPIWDLMDKHDFAGVHAKLAELQAVNAKWNPSARLLAKVSLGEARDHLIQASDDHDWAEVIKLAVAQAPLLSSKDFDVLWRTAEALAHVGDEDQAFAVYNYAMLHAAVPGERLATVQKASLLLTPAKVDSLMALGKRGADGQDEFAGMRLDIARRKIGDAAAGKGGVRPSAAELDALAQEFERHKDTGDAQLLGWYAYAQKNLPEAEVWFRRAMAVKIEAKSAEGLVLVLRDEGKQQEAQTLAYESRDLDKLNREELIGLQSAAILGPNASLVPPQRIAALAQAIETNQSGDGAQVFGWYRFKAKDPAGAQAWFRKAAVWKDSEPVAVGLLLCSTRLNERAEFAKVARTYRTKYPRVAQLEALMRPGAAVGHVAQHEALVHPGAAAGHVAHQSKAMQAKAAPDEQNDKSWDQSADEIVKTFKSGNYDKSLALLDARKQKRSESNGLALIHGWALYHQGDWVGARKAFSALAASGDSLEARNAIRVINESETPLHAR